MTGTKRDEKLDEWVFGYLKGALLRSYNVMANTHAIQDMLLERGERTDGLVDAGDLPEVILLQALVCSKILRIVAGAAQVMTQEEQDFARSWKDRLEEFMIQCDPPIAIPLYAPID